MWRPLFTILAAFSLVLALSLWFLDGQDLKKYKALLPQLNAASREARACSQRNSAFRDSMHGERTAEQSAEYQKLIMQGPQRSARRPASWRS